MLQGVLRAAKSDVGGHSLHLVLLDVGVGGRVRFRHAQHKLPPNELALQANEDLGAGRLTDSDDFGDRLGRQVESVYEHAVLLRKVRAVTSEQFGEACDAWVDHAPILNPAQLLPPSQTTRPITARTPKTIRAIFHGLMGASPEISPVRPLIMNPYDFPLNW